MNFSVQKSLALPLLYFIVVLCNVCSAVKDGLREDPFTISINLTEKHTSHRYNIDAGTTKILIKNAVQEDGFFLIQVHSFVQKVTLANDTNFNIQNSVYGTNIGFVKILLPTDVTKTIPFYLRTEQNAMVLIAVIVYSSADPIPGGCSMTFNTEIAPYLNLTYTDALIEVNYQDSSIFQHFCEESKVRLEMYRVYVTPTDLTSQTYFQNIEKMLSVDDIRKNGENITDLGEQTKNLRKYISGYMGLGQIIAIVGVTGDRSSAYVPAITYSCNIIDGYQSCYTYNTIWWGLLSAMMLVFGLVMFVAEDFGGVFTNLLLSTGISTYVLYNFLDTMNVSTWVTTVTLIVFIISCCVFFGCIFGIGGVSLNYLKFVVSLLCGLYVGTLVVTGGNSNMYNPTAYWNVFVAMSAVMFSIIFGFSFINPFAYNLMAVALITMSLSYFTDGTIYHIVTDVVRYMTITNYAISVKVDLHSSVIIIGGVLIALLRSICIKAEGRLVLTVKIVRTRARADNYSQF